MAKIVNESNEPVSDQPSKRGKKPGMVAYKVYISESDNQLLLESADGRQPNDWLSRLIASTGIISLVDNHRSQQ